MKALLVDDERLARVGLRRLLEAYADITVVGEAANADEAVSQIRRLHPDVVFLDVEMPGHSGLEMLENLEELPAVIFTTAYEEYALRAFDVSAVDYLLKPVEAERLGKALAKARQLLEARANAQVGLANIERLKSALTQLPRPYLQRLVGRRGNKLHLLPIDDVQACVSEDELVFALAPAGRFLINHTLKDLEERIDPEKFARVHKQTIVNLGAISEIDPLLKGGATARLHCGITIEISRRYAVGLRQKLGW
jgi:two-component system LytT family response regulator